MDHGNHYEKIVKKVRLMKIQTNNLFSKPFRWTREIRSVVRDRGDELQLLGRLQIGLRKVRIVVAQTDRDRRAQFDVGSLQLGRRFIQNRFVETSSQLRRSARQSRRLHDSVVDYFHQKCSKFAPDRYGRYWPTYKWTIIFS